jgi:hypothetical protein
MIDARVAMTGADGSCVADRYRLITTLTDHRAFPAAALVRLYHERWEIESVASELQFPESAGDLHAARPYSLIRPPRTLRRRIFGASTSTTTAGAISSAPGGRRLRPRCGQCSL